MNKKIEFSNEQYETLVRLIFYGDWILNANKSKSEEMDKQAGELLEYVYSKKGDFDLQNWFKELKFGEELKESITMELLDKVFEYNEETFIFYLIQKLSEKDAMREYEAMNIDNDDDELYENLVYKFENKYEKIITKNGINYLEMNLK